MTTAMDGVLEAIARDQHGLFTGAQARRAGASVEMVRHRVRIGRWWRVHPGVFALLGAERSPAFWIHAVVLSAGADAVASHTTAAALFGLPGFPLAARPRHVTIPVHGGRASGPAKVHRTLRLPESHRRLAQGVPCTSVARTLFDLCGLVPVARAERAMDNALARRLVTVADLEDVAGDLTARGRAGSKSFGRLLRDRGAAYVPPESELEARFAALVRSFDLPEPTRQLDIGDADGWIGRVDFAYRRARVVVECDGELAHSSVLDRRADGERDRRLEAAGWRVLRFTWSDVDGRPAEVVARVDAALRASTEAIGSAKVHA